MSFLREAFSEDGQGSASRVMMLLHALVGITWVSYFMVRNPAHALPDAATMAGVTGFICAPYAINKFSAGVDSVVQAVKRP